MTLSDFRSKHRGQPIVVCGCGESLRTIENCEGYTTIGVNDIGRFFDPTYLVVLNREDDFSSDRLQYITGSKARTVFSHLKLRLESTPLTKIKIARNRLAFGENDSFGCSNNSPFVAALIAAYMGAPLIGLLGVDFSKRRFSEPTRTHHLASELDRINADYSCLAKRLALRGTLLVNLSKESGVTVLPRCDFQQFSELSSDRASRVEKLREMSGHSQRLFNSSAFYRGRRQIGRNGSRNPHLPAPFLAVQNHRSPMIQQFLDTFADSAERAGYRVSRNMDDARRRGNLVAVVWNGRNAKARGPVVYCEHGWLPRASFQISSKGINADSCVTHRLRDSLCEPGPTPRWIESHISTLQKDALAREGRLNAEVPLPPQFILVPLQMDGDTNIVRHAPPFAKTMQGLVDHLSKWDPDLPIVFKQHPADASRRNAQLGLNLHRKRDLLLPANAAGIHNLLHSNECIGVVSVNSNALHDALMWGVPSVALGRGIWSAMQEPPFLVDGLPSESAAFERHRRYLAEGNTRLRYLAAVVDAQYSISDIRNPDTIRLIVKQVTMGR